VSLRYSPNSLHVADLIIQYLLDPWRLGCDAVCDIFFPFLRDVISTLWKHISKLGWEDNVTKWLDSDAELEFIKVVDEGKSVHVTRTSITKDNSKTVTLSNGQTIECDAIIFATG
jgi:hypothetical protein